MENLKYYQTDESIEDFYAPIFASSKWLSEDVLTSNPENVDTAFHNAMSKYFIIFDNRADFDMFMIRNAETLDSEILEEYDRLNKTECEQCGYLFVSDGDERFCCEHCKIMHISDMREYWDEEKWRVGL